MKDSQRVLLQLLRIATGWERATTLPPDVDWKEVVSLAEQQDVLSIVADGYELYLRNNPGTQSFLSKNGYEDLKMKMFSSVFMSENNYKLHKNVLGKLCQIFNKANIPFIVMKGLSCGRYYPNPGHRLCGDIDIYAGKDFEESNKALLESGIAVEPHYYRHTVSVLHGVTIENHRILCDLRGPRKQTTELESLLETIARKSIEEGESYGTNYPGAHYPVPDFNALFLPWHVSAHFEFERVTLRHLLDWALFLYHDGKIIDLQLFKDSKARFTYGLGPFADIMTDLSIRYLGLPEESLPKEMVEDAARVDRVLSDKVFDRIFEATVPASDSNVWKERWKLFKYVLKDGWKYRGLYGMSTIKFLLYKGYGVLFKVGEE